MDFVAMKSKIIRSPWTRESGDESHAVQTLRVCLAPPNFAKRLDCGCFSTAFQRSQIKIRLDNFYERRNLGFVKQNRSENWAQIIRSHRTILTKRKLLFSGVTTVFVCIVCCCSKPATPESRFRDLFTYLSIGVPEYQTFHGFSQPEDTIKGDFCTVDFSQSQTQFREFVTRLGVSQASIISSNSFWIKADYKGEPKYPWMLKVQAHTSNLNSNTWEIHIEGMQPYDQPQQLDGL